MKLLKPWGGTSWLGWLGKKVLIAMLLLIVLAPLYSIIFPPPPPKGWDISHPEAQLKFMINWQYYQGETMPSLEDAWRPLDEAMIKELFDYKGYLWLKRKLPDIGGRDPYLFLNGMNETEVWVDGSSVYSYNTDRSERFVNSFAMLHQIRLQPSDGGKPIMIRTYWEKQPFVPYWNTVGERLTLFRENILMDWKTLVYSVIFLVAGTVSCVMFIRRTEEWTYFWFAFLCYCAGFGIGMLSSSLQWLVDIQPLYYFRDLMLPLGMVGFIGFYGAALRGAYLNLFRVLVSVMSLYTLFAAGMALTDNSMYHQLISKWLPYVMVILFSVITWILIQYARRHRSADTRLLLGGYLSLLTLGTVHVLNNLFAFTGGDYLHIPQLLQRSIPHALSIGVFLFISSLAMVMFRRFSAVHQQLKQYAQELAATNEEMAKFAQLKDDFLRNTSHELRTPLHGIAGLTESLLDGAAGPIDEAMKSNLQLVLNSSQRLLRLVNDILDLYRLKHRDLQLESEHVNVRKTAEVVIAALAPLAKRKGLQAVVQISEEALYVKADANRLEQILYNLIGNAIRYTETGQVSVKAATSGGIVTIMVEDTGEGIPPERINTLFEPFASAENSLGGGTGLGLSITKRLVELHGGTISVFSAPHEGTRVSFTLPIADEQPTTYEHEAVTGLSRRFLEEAATEAALPLAPEPILEHAASYTAEISSAELRRKPLIFIADDEPINLQVLRHYLRSESYRLVQAKDGMEAMLMLEAGEKPDLLLLDVMMPGLTGYEVCRYVRGKWGPNELPIILLSARNRVVDLTEGFDAGANDYISKPFSQGELLARVQIQLKLAQFHQTLEELVKLRTGELEETNRTLAGSVRETAEALTEVSVLEERNRIAHEIHDVVGHTLTAAIVQLEAAKKLADRDFVKSLEKLDVSKELVRKGLEEIRRAVRMLKDEGSSFELVPALHELLNETRAHTGITIECRLEPLPVLSDLTQRVIYHALMEGMTNGIRHGRCSWFSFELYPDNDWLHFQLTNDGEAYGNAKPGFGLTSMMERVHLLGGAVHIGSRSDSDGKEESDGCQLVIALPLPFNGA
jgi:two-component system sensor histidine kinase ChiS